MTQHTGAADGAPNPIVAQSATRKAAMPLNEVALLGVAGPEDALRALIRMPDGAIVTAALGEQTALGRLIEVSQAGVVIRLADGLATFLRPYPWGRHPPAT